MQIYQDLYFTTATILHWYPLLESSSNKDIIIDAFRFATREKRTRIWAFVIMDNHFHIVWQILPPYTLEQVRQNLLKYTAQKIRNKMLEELDDFTLRLFIKHRGDRYMQIWKRKPLSIAIYNDHVLNQKINYIHSNLLKKGRDDVTYKYSSASFYATGVRNWDFL
jgi:putative transposase